MTQKGEEGGYLGMRNLKLRLFSSNLLVSKLFLFEKYSLACWFNRTKINFKIFFFERSEANIDNYDASKTF